MIDSSKKRNRQLAIEFQNSHVCEKAVKASDIYGLRFEYSSMRCLCSTGNNRCSDRYFSRGTTNNQ